jgi:uncharacterized membrane protein YfcA
MSPLELTLIGAAVFATAALSGVLGMAGGIALLGVLLVYLPPLVAIPLHGVIQLVSNGSRVIVQRKHARFDWILWYTLPLLPAGLVGLRVAQRLPEAALEGAIGVVVLAATWLPKRGERAARAARRPRARFFALGTFSGVANMLRGAIGPAIDPFFLGLGLSRHAGRWRPARRSDTPRRCSSSAAPASPSPSMRRCSRWAPSPRSRGPGSAAACSTGSARRASSGSTAWC